MENNILRRVLKESGYPGIIPALLNLSNTDLHSLLLVLFNHKSQQVQPTKLLRAYQNNQFVQPAALPQRPGMLMHLKLLEMLPPNFDVLELSPLGPLGCCSALATVNQNKIISALRQTEVVADATNMLALECASRRQNNLRTHGKRNEPVHLATTHRLVRNQPVKHHQHNPHFRIIGLCSAGRDGGNYQFEIENLSRHLQYYQQVLEHLRKHRRFEYKVQVTLRQDIDNGAREFIWQSLVGALPELSLEAYHDRTSAKTYYPLICFQVAMNFKGEETTVADGGFTSWTQDMLSNRKERLLISGLGTEMIRKILEL